MSFATEITKQINSKVILGQLDIGKQNTAWVPFCGAVWNANLLNIYPQCDIFNDCNPTPVMTLLGSIVCNGLQMSKVSSPQACLNKDSSFYYERATQMIYLHCPNADDPDLFKIRLGQIYGFRKGGVCASYNGIDFQNRLIDVPAISLNKDPGFYGVVSFDSMSLKIANADGKYDHLTRNENVFGNKGRIIIGFDGWNILDFQQIFEGMIGKITTDEEYLIVELKDMRSSLSKSIPSNILTTEDYPALDPGDVGKPLPRVFGTCRNVPCYVIDQKQDTSCSTRYYHAKIGDTEYTTAINAINIIYVNDKVVTSTGKNLNTRLFTLKYTTDTATIYNPGDEVTADVIGEVNSQSNIIQNSALIIKKLLFDYYDIPYTSDFYNTAYWDELTAKNIGIWLGEQKPLIDVIGEICNEGTLADFFVDGNGKYCLRIWDTNRAVIQTIKRNQILKTPVITDDPAKTITSTLIGYNRDWANDEYRLFVDTSQEQDIFDKYPIYNQKRFDTLMPNISGAQTYSDDVFVKSDDVETIIEVQCPGWGCIERIIGDIVIVYCNRRSTEWYRRCKCEVIGIAKDFNQHIVSLTLRLISRLDDIPYTQSSFYTNNSANGTFHIVPTIGGWGWEFIRINEVSGEKSYYCNNYNGADKKYWAMTVNES